MAETWEQKRTTDNTRSVYTLSRVFDTDDGYGLNMSLFWVVIPCILL